MKHNELIDTKRDEILKIAKQYGAYNVRVFGTQAIHGEVNFIVNLESGRNFLDQGGLLMELRDLLACEVGVFTEGGLKDNYRKRVLKGAIPL